MGVFWVVVSCSLADVYQCSRGTCCLHHHGNDGGSKDVWNCGKLLPTYTALQRRREPTSFWTLWGSQYSLINIAHLLWNKSYKLNGYEICSVASEKQIQKLKSFSFSVWHWTTEHMWLRLCGAVWRGHRDQCGDIHGKILWRGEWGHYLFIFTNILITCQQGKIESILSGTVAMNDNLRRRL